MVECAKKVFWGLGVGAFTNLLPVAPLWAQQFTVSPLVTITESRNGQVKGTISVINQDAKPLRMRVYAESFTYDRQKGFVFTAKDDRSAAPYLQFSPREMEIPPGVTRNVRLGVVFPANLPNQEYRVAVFVEDLKEREVKPSSSGSSVLLVKARVASVFFFSKGTTNANVQASTAVWDVANKKISILLENQGTQSAYPEVNWRINKNGQEVAKEDIRGVIVQSQNSREVALTTNGQPLKLASGEYTLSGTILTTGQKPSSFNIKVMVP